MLRLLRTATILRPLHRTNCVSRHPRLTTGGFCWSKLSDHIPLLTATSASGLGRKCQSSQQCYLRRLPTFIYLVHIQCIYTSAILKLSKSRVLENLARVRQDVCSWLRNHTWAIVTSAKEDMFCRCLFVCLIVSNFVQKLPSGFAWNFQGSLVMGQWTND